MTYDDFDLAIAAEEHTQGLTYGQPDHCGTCDQRIRHARIELMRATCEHEDVLDPRTLGEILGRLICATCGTTLREAL